MKFRKRVSLVIPLEEIRFDVLMSIFFCYKKGNYLTLRLRWKNVTGLCNPCWHCDIDKPKDTIKKTTMKELKTLLKEKNIKGYSKLKKSGLIELAKSHNIQFK